MALHLIGQCPQLLRKLQIFPGNKVVARRLCQPLALCRFTAKFFCLFVQPTSCSGAVCHFR